MAVSFRTVGTWAELIADGSVAIPATPQAGDRMYLFARWKDFAITAQVTTPSGWTELVEFADGSTGSGNGTGSVKVACWYRDWQSGDTDPTIDFSSSPTNASAVIIVMAKDATDSWLTPVAVTAAMTNWTTSSQTVAASSTVVVLGGGVVIGLIGIRDDTVTMTRPTSGIDDSAGAVTWNGNYVEAPATHHSTTTGDDGAADLGYRLVTSGATATLRMTGTISAAETGAALWVAQGVQANLLIDNASNDHSAASVTLTQVHALNTAVASHGHTAANLGLTQVHVLAVQNANLAHVAESLTFTQIHALAIQAANHAHGTGGLTLTVVYDLETQDAAHSHSGASIALAQVHELTVGNGTHGHTAGSPDLTQVHNLIVGNGQHSHTTESPNVRTFAIVWIDPGGDAVQAIGYFNVEGPASDGDVTFDNTEWVVGVGSYKFDSGAGGEEAYVITSGVLGASRRVSTYFWYDSLPDIVQSTTEFVNSASEYSGGGFTDASGFMVDEGVYATATPAQNDGQGSVFSSLSFDLQPDVTIVSVKIIYERKYDTDTSIGISRVKWRVNGDEGPNHDNTDMPLTDTVVEVDVTGDRSWEPQHLADGVFEVIAEARRGDSAVEHVQSWDYVKVEVVYHPATTIIAAYEGSDITFSIALVSKGNYGVVRFTEGLGSSGRLSYDGITKLFPDAKNRISFAYVSNGADDLDIKVYVNSVEELSIEGSATNGWDGTSVIDLYYGWIHTPGVDHVAWVDQIYIDDGDDLNDSGDILSTAKLPATVNQNNWNTTGGTGAVNERPLSETNYKQETRASQFRQTYTLEAADSGDIDISSETLIGYMGWAWARKAAGSFDGIAMVINGVDVFDTYSGIDGIAATALPTFIYQALTSASYPSDAAGIGMLSNNESADTFLYECGVIAAYRNPIANPDLILAYQELEEGTILDLLDDLRSAPPESYEFCYRSSDSDTATALITVTSLEHEDGNTRQQISEFALNGGLGRTRIPAGVEVQIHLEIVGGPLSVGLWHRLNVD